MGVYWRYFVYIYASYNIIVLAVIKMQNVKNFIQGKALGVAEYWTPVLKVILHCLGWSLRSSLRFCRLLLV